VNAGLILAAGESRRMGSAKALLPYQGVTFLERLAGLFAAHCSPVIIVLGAGSEEIRARAPHSAQIVVNHEYRRGQLSSMQCGLRAVPEDAGGVLFTLVDHPAIAPETVAALVAATRPGTRFRVPRYQGRRGHPIWFSRDVVPEFLALPETGAARDVVRAHLADTEFLDVDDAGVVADIDDRAAFRALTGETR
jgi:CTP:molybdopterin cytidylyltransferase MocA